MFISAPLVTQVSSLFSRTVSLLAIVSYYKLSGICSNTIELYFLLDISFIAILFTPTPGVTQISYIYLSGTFSLLSLFT